jgi:Asp-tRNA(Asn)/Glu-tRNA(Gln) amidotransferase B subunit
MEKGNLRADVNVSVRRPGEPFGTRCEIKNMNSIRFIGQAIHYEARRQIGILEDGGTIDQETRLYDPNKGETRSMRSRKKRTTTDTSRTPICCRWNSPPPTWTSSRRRCRNFPMRSASVSWRTLV